MDLSKWFPGSLVFYWLWTIAGSSNFNFYWNIPTFMCKKYQITFDELETEYGIIQNQNDSFRGDRISILYDPGLFPAILQNISSKEFFYRNHGVPQKGNLSEHLQIFENQLVELIPDYNFTGIAIIDFESWRPIYRQNFGTLTPYKTLSMQIEQKNHPFWPKKQIERESEANFEKGGKSFMLETLLTAKKIRPYAKWGYYAFPYCFNNGNKNNPDQCAKGVREENNMIHWMFQASDVIYPSVYLQERIPPINRIPFVRGRVNEALRIAKMLFNEKQKPKVLVYYRYLFTDTLKFIDTANTIDVFREAKYLGADGIILWGSSYDLNTKGKCQQFQTYVKESILPAIRLARLPDV